MKKVFLYFAALAVCVSCLDKETNDDPVTFSGLSVLSSTAVSDAKYVALLADEARSRSGAYGNGELCRIDADGVMSALDFEFSLECTDPEAEKEVRRWLKEDVSFSFGGMTVVHDKYLYLKFPGISTAVDENAGEDPYFTLKQEVLSELRTLLAPPDRQVFVVLRLSDGRVFLPSEQQFPDIDKNWWHYSPDNGETVYFTDSFCGGNLYRLSHGDGDLDVELLCSDTGDSQS